MAASPSPLYALILDMREMKARQAARDKAVLEDKSTNLNRPEYVDIFKRVLENCTVAGKDRIMAAAHNNYNYAEIYRGPDLDHVLLAPHYHKMFISDLLSKVKESLGPEFSIAYIPSTDEEWHASITATWPSPP